MSNKNKSMHCFDSKDFIEDAIESLEKSKFQYVILTATAPGLCQVDSNLNLDELEIFRRNIINAINVHIDQAIRRRDSE